MEDLLKFATPCRWIKWDMDPDSRLDFTGPKRGVLYLTRESLEFVGSLKTYGGNLRATLVTLMAARIAGPFTFSLPLALIQSITARQASIKLPIKEFSGTYLEILYYSDKAQQSLRKLMAYPHFGPLPARGEKARYYICAALSSLYREEAEANNWARLIDHQRSLLSAG